MTANETASIMEVIFMNKTMLKEKMRIISDAYRALPQGSVMAMGVIMLRHSACVAALRYEQRMVRLKSKALVRKFEEEFDSEMWRNELDSVGYDWSVFY